MLTIFLIISAFILFISCQTSDDATYQNISSSDFQFIPENYQDTEKIMTFRNQENDEVKIKSIFYSITKEYDNGYGFGQPSSSDSYYYDDLWITLELLNVNIQNEGTNYCNNITIHIKKARDSRLSTRLEIPYYDDPFCGGNGFNIPSPYENFTQIEIYNINTIRHSTWLQHL